MAQRADIEEKLLRGLYPAYTSKIRELYRRSTYDVESSQVIEEIWAYCRPRLASLGHFGKSIEKDAQQLSAYNEGMLTPQIFSIIKDYMYAAREYEEKLYNSTDKFVSEEYKRLIREKKAYDAELAANRDTFAWFNLPDCDVDETYWSIVEYFTSDQAAALALGKDPRKVHAQKLMPFDKVSRSLFTEKYGRLIVSLDSYGHNKMVDGLLSKKDFATWAAKYSILLPWDKAVAAVDYEAEPLDKRELHSLYRIIIGFAVSGFGFDATRQYEDNEISIKAISKAVATSGVAISEKTLNKHLKNAYRYITTGENPAFKVKLTLPRK